MSINKRNITLRLYFIGLILITLIISLVFKLIELQFFHGDHYIDISKEREFKREIIPANRGNIYSDEGKLLASSVPKYEIRFDALAPSEKNFKNYIEKLAVELSNFYGKTAEFYINKLIKARSNKNRYLLIARDLGYLEFTKFKNFPLFNLGPNKGGFIYNQTTKRDYPIREIAKRTLGYEKYDDLGNSIRPGIDGAFGPTYLKGINGSRLSQKIGQGQWKPIMDFNQIEPRDGYDVYTTLNIELQDLTHHTLLNQLKKYEADHGCVVIMETETGEIKAISNLGLSQNGNYYEKLNYAVGESHEPGSTFKLMSLIRALEDNVVDTSKIIDTKNGIINFYGKKIKDSRVGGYGKISLAKAFELSSNTAFAEIINDNYSENPYLFVDGLFSMNINNKLGLPILGEGSPVFTHPSDKKNWDGLDLPWMAFGYGIQLTPLQTLTFYNAIANNGKMVKPLFIKQVKYFDNTIENFQTEIINDSVCSPKTIAIVKNLLKNVVEKRHGTANNIFSDEYSMAGKTGTSQTEYWKSDDLYISSFVGYFPADKPKYSCIVVIHKPNKNKGYYGNIVAAPVFKEIAHKIYSNTPLVEYYSEKKYIKNSGEKKINAINELNSLIMPNLNDFGINELIPILENAGFSVVIDGNGLNVSQSILPGTKLNKGQEIKINLI